ncbi:alpha/beta fold hydrolase [Nocardia higoensis]|uniref:Alpha/beta fold hydrolase n=1 Tax=Nocardia higoensis TaxID=228599 RepID=A0ABS0DIU3_9NOCA|nr:alpha/beta fold hydrolase [Nocardia higoensis]MBF6358055.1 alpha/beta fold hydrolase [Nocardia higoensis]
MPKLGHFADAAEKARFLRAYDAVAARWPVPSVDLDIATSFGTTRVRKSGVGEGAPLLLLPGIGGNAMFWEPFIEELARDRVVYTSDVLGWAGRGEQTAPIRDEADIAEWGTQLVAGLGVERIHLAGYSAGAWLATVIGAAGDNRLAGISLLEPAPATFARPPWKVLRKFLFAGFRPTRAKIEKLNQWLSPAIRLTEEDWALTLSALAFRPGMPWARPLPAERFRRDHRAATGDLRRRDGRPRCRTGGGSRPAARSLGRDRDLSRRRPRPALGDPGAGDTAVARIRRQPRPRDARLTKRPAIGSRTR